MSCSMVSKAADRSRIASDVMCCLSIDHSMSLVSLMRLVSMLKCFQYADWKSGSRLWFSQCSRSCLSMHFSTSLDMNGRFDMGL